MAMFIYVKGMNWWATRVAGVAGRPGGRGRLGSVAVSPAGRAGSLRRTRRAGRTRRWPPPAGAPAPSPPSIRPNGNSVTSYLVANFLVYTEKSRNYDRLVRGLRWKVRLANKNGLTESYI